MLTGIFPICILLFLDQQRNFSRSTEKTRSRSYLLSSSFDEVKFSSSAQESVQAAVLKISYDGTHFNGWSSANDGETPVPPFHNVPEEGNFPYVSSRRKSGKKYRRPYVRSVEGTIKNCLQKLYGNIDIQLIDICGCSRTDKGVHARNMIISFNAGNKSLPFDGDLQKLVYVLNRMLPFDIRVQNVCYEPVSGFHPTIDAISKTYTYHFSIGQSPDPLRWRHELQIEGRHQFDIKRAKAVAKLMKGTFDFSAFRGAFRGNERGKVKDPTCTIFEIEIDYAILSELILTTPPHPDKLVGGHMASVSYVIKIRGNRFLYKMVRFLSGTLISAGLGDITENEVKYALENGQWERNLTNNISCAPANGLILTQVEYDENIPFQWIY